MCVIQQRRAAARTAASASFVRSFCSLPCLTHTHSLASYSIIISSIIMFRVARVLARASSVARVRLVTAPTLVASQVCARARGDLGACWTSNGY